MMTIFAAERVFDTVGRDELGIEYGAANGGRVQTSYQPIFAIGRRGQLRLSGLRAGCVLSGSVEAAAGIAPALAAPLALRNFGHSGSDDLDLYLDHSIASGWSPQGLMDCAAHERAGGSLLPEPRRVFLECAPGGSVPTFPHNGVFRRAMVNERPEDELDDWVAQLRPSIIRLEGKWLASLSRHAATRALLASLVGRLKQRGVKSLFEGLDDEEMVGLALECEADFAQGAALAMPVVAGELIDARAGSAKVISVDFARGRKPTVA